MAKKKTEVTQATAATDTIERVDTTKTSVEQAPTPAKGKRGRKKKDANVNAAQADATSDATSEGASAAGPFVRDAFEGYLRGLEEDGASTGTCFSYKMELAMAGQELGLDMPLRDLTPERVLEFFTSDRVMRTKTGREKAAPTFLKTRRVIRQALVWAAKAKLVDQAPLPEEAATF